MLRKRRVGRPLIEESEEEEETDFEPSESESYASRTEESEAEEIVQRRRPPYHK